MRFASFFITRPIFAIVLSLLIVVGGLLALFRLPISEYPGVVPPTVIVRAAFPGANPKVIAETVASSDIFPTETPASDGRPSRFANSPDIRTRPSVIRSERVAALYS